MRMRRRGVGIVGVAAVAHHASSKGAQQQAAADQQAAQQEAAAPPPAAAPAAAPATDLTSQLEQLASLHTAGVLSDEEFAAGKAKLLGG